VRELTDEELRQAEFDLMNPLVRAEAALRDKLNTALSPFAGRPVTEEVRIEIERVVREITGPPVTVYADFATQTFKVIFE
jgi:hypothetical protein